MLGPIMIDLLDLTLGNKDKQRLKNPAVGGVILFTRNYKSKKQITSLINSIRNINKDILIAIDHEGGRVQRFKDGFTHIPAMGELGKLYDKKPNEAVNKTKEYGFILAKELLDIGVDFSFAPVLDLDYGNSEVIGNRSFHANPKIVSILATALISGMNKAGMLAVGKHFPGHGYVSDDSHFNIVIDNRDYEKIKKDISVYENIDSLSAVMLAHVIYSKIDEKPTCFSKVWIKDILRNKLNFKGIVFSDDLSMKSAYFFEENIVKRTKLAIESGCDMILICNNVDAVDEVLGNDWEKSNKLIKMCAKNNQIKR